MQEIFILNSNSKYSFLFLMIANYSNHPYLVIGLLRVKLSFLVEHIERDFPRLESPQDFLGTFGNAGIVNFNVIGVSENVLAGFARIETHFSVLMILILFNTKILYNNDALQWADYLDCFKFNVCSKCTQVFV